MKIGILQPSYLPWLGFFEQVAQCDVFVLYDDVQYDKHGWRNRNKIKTPQGAQWLTVPVRVRYSEKPLICEVEIDNSTPWQRKHYSSIKQNYKKAPFFGKYDKIFDDMYRKDWRYLADLDTELIMAISGFLGIDTGKIIRSSALGIAAGGRVERLIAICEHCKADVFYEGAAGKNYIDPESFRKHNSEVLFQNYIHPAYEQQYGSFIPYLSIIDLLCNQGDKSLEILKNKEER